MQTFVCLVFNLLPHVIHKTTPATSKRNGGVVEQDQMLGQSKHLIFLWSAVFWLPPNMDSGVRKPRGEGDLSLLFPPRCEFKTFLQYEPTL